MRTHIVPIYVILGCMAVAVLGIGAKPVEHESKVQPREAAKATAMTRGLPAPGEMFVVMAPKLDAELAMRIELAVARAKAGKSG
jgi:hypothetical protein